ncbi:hypothetical protein BCL64_108134 [Halomonas ventosae]|uniref:Uncharacterized protein n=1 Tax=Halomonas ventosae TaxID=229007 RepID=A0A2T0VM86_9GAMM|nr:hypothetical protein BCL64_108134 [Halomonas ventosae]
MSEHRSRPLGRDEIEFLVQLANGNALARQRRRDREARRPRPRHRQDE